MGVSLDVVFYRAVILDRIIFARHTNGVIVHYAKNLRMKFRSTGLLQFSNFLFSYGLSTVMAYDKRSILATLNAFRNLIDIQHL